jgi:nucleoside-diphosphate-sugar epimerase
MKKIFLTGASGFVGSNVLNYFGEKNTFCYYKQNEVEIDLANIVIHLAGKAHDIRKVTKVEEYYKINTDLTQKLFDAFLYSDAKVFIVLSSVKAVADQLDIPLTEDYIPNPITHYGKSKLLAEEYILSKQIPSGKRVYILRPCMIHGPGNKGNLNLLYKNVNKGFPWPLGAFENKRSFCSIDNLCFIINELINNESIPSGVYNIADNEPLATNDLIKLIAESQKKNYHIWNVPKSIIKLLFQMGDLLKLPLNSERLSKLTETYIVSNNKIITAINKPLPLSAKEGLMKTLNSFNTNVK